MIHDKIFLLNLHLYKNEEHEKDLPILHLLSHLQAKEYVRMSGYMAIAWAPETRIVPIAPPCAVAMAQIVSSVCCIFTMSFAFKSYKDTAFQLISGKVWVIIILECKVL